jgi:molybdopterin biosynthesis enzyme MoaB
MEQIVEIQRCQSSAVLGSGTVGIVATSGFGIGPRDVTPTNLLGVGKDTGLDGFVFPG